MRAHHAGVNVSQEDGVSVQQRSVSSTLGRLGGGGADSKNTQRLNHHCKAQSSGKKKKKKQQSVMLLCYVVQELFSLV